MSRGLRTIRRLACARAERGGSFGRDTRGSLARAESEGAAPGTEWRAHVAVESSPVGARDARPTVLAFVAALALALGLWEFGGALYIHAKAEVAQMLLRAAWARSHKGAAARPWPWADTHPVARLTVPAHRVDVLVLEGANGRALAFGPGHVESSALPGDPGHSVLSAHRDTHFRFLRALAVGDEIDVERADGRRVAYRVTALSVRDERDLALARDAEGRLLTLVTCYPFDAIRPGGPLRYVVTARANGGA